MKITNCKINISVMFETELNVVKIPISLQCYYLLQKVCQVKPAMIGAFMHPSDLILNYGIHFLQLVIATTTIIRITFIFTDSSLNHFKLGPYCHGNFVQFSFGNKIKKSCITTLKKKNSSLDSKISRKIMWFIIVKI